MLLLHIFMCLGLSGFVSPASAEFVPACYVDRSAEATNTSGETQHLVTTNVTILPHRPILSGEVVVVPRAECGLDIYFHGPFVLLDIKFREAVPNCHISTAGFAKPVLVRLKTGETDPDPRYPDVPLHWWSSRASTLVLLKVSKVSAGQVGVYQCDTPDIGKDVGIYINISVNVNGCPTGKWDKNCERDCECVNGGTCHSWDGSCRCPKAWTGSTCHLENPHVEVETNTTDAYFGDPLTITCSAHGIEVQGLNVTWLLNKSNTLNGSWALDIPSWRDSDAGTYTCRVVDSFGKVYRDSVDIQNIGCRPGWRGPDCNLKCSGCLNEGRCDRFLGCVCGEGWSGDRCEQAVCSATLHRLLCGRNKDHSKTIGLAVGGGILVLVASAGAFIWCYFRPCQKITITMESHDDYFRSNDAGDLVRNKERLVSEDLGILLAHWEMEESMLYIGKKLGEGYFSSVSSGHILKDNTLYNVAVKILKDENDSVSWANFIGEFRILSHICPHRNIVQLLGLCSKPVFNQVVTCLVLEHLAIGSLHTVLRDNRKPEQCDTILAPKDYVKIALDILSGMAHLEDLRFVHRDLATRNILLTERLVAKVSDFGLARDAYSTGDYRLEGARGKKLPWKWMSFESLKDGVYTSKSDMWSFGVLLWEMVTLGACPYPGVCNEDLLSHLETGKRPECPRSCSRVWYAAMKTCWLEDPDDRPSFRDFLPFFRDHFLLTQTASPFVDSSRGEAEVARYQSGLPDLITDGDVLCGHLTQADNIHDEQSPASGLNVKTKADGEFKGHKPNAEWRRNSVT